MSPSEGDGMQGAGRADERATPTRRQRSSTRGRNTEDEQAQHNTSQRRRTFGLEHEDRRRRGAAPAGPAVAPVPRSAHPHLQCTSNRQRRGEWVGARLIVTDARGSSWLREAGSGSQANEASATERATAQHAHAGRRSTTQQQSRRVTGEGVVVVTLSVWSPAGTLSQ
jgi:hypothetical protein